MNHVGKQERVTQNLGNLLAPRHTNRHRHRADVRQDPDGDV